MIEVRDVSVDLGAFALHHVNLTVETGQYFILLGPTGAGKTILLESIAGVQPIEAGEIWLGGRDVTRLAPEERKASIVYQDHMLFPHYSVRQNVAFGLRMQRVGSRQIAAAVSRVVELLGIEHLLTRSPDTLSGGEKQKVALARAVVIDPEVLLLDEPLGALDPQTRGNVQQELVTLQDELGITVLHVTHDFEEAITMGDRIAVMGDGAIWQEGVPDEVFRHPNSEFVARFTMAGNVLAGVAVKEDGETVFVVEGARIRTEADWEGSCHASIRPEDVVVSDLPRPDWAADRRNHVSAVITDVLNKGSVVELTVNLPPPLTCLLTRHTYQQMDLRVGQEVIVSISPSAVHLFQE